jgi:hypothetical protein
MRIHRLLVENVAGIGVGEIAFGPGLNVLYGPNDLGKSTLADAIRLVLLLPHTSTHCERFVPWTGGQDPMVELTFQTDAQRFWRVRKQFGKGGSSVLQESRDGRQFDEVERARRVDAKLREILRWGIPEPGGSGAAKGLPTSFLATALLSTQANVTAILEGSLERDAAPTGKERIAAALQAIAQDPLFVGLLRTVQSRRDEAYTDKGAKKTAKGSVFKAAADCLNEAREEKDRLQKVVHDSEGVESQLRELMSTRVQYQEDLRVATEGLAAVELLTRHAEELAAGAECVRVAQEAVRQIRKMDEEVAVAGQNVESLVGKRDNARQALKIAQDVQATADDGLRAAEETARAAGLDPAMADTVARQDLVLRRSAAEQVAMEAQRAIDALAVAQNRVDELLRAQEEHGRLEAMAAQVREESSRAGEAEKAVGEQLQRCDLLERALEAQAADGEVVNSRSSVDKEAGLRAQLQETFAERVAAAKRRAAVIVPAPEALAPMRKLAADLAGARGALNVGLVVTVTPRAPLDLQVRKDGAQDNPGLVAQPFEIEATSDVEVGIADLATVRVRGGRREAQDTVRRLEARWTGEVAPHLAAAGASDLEVLEARVAEARELDASLKEMDRASDVVRRDISALAGAKDALTAALSRGAACHAALGDVSLESLRAELDRLGKDAGTALRARRQQASQEAETARSAAREAATRHSVAEERVRAARSTLETAKQTRDAAVRQYPSGIAESARAAQASLHAAVSDQEKIAAELGVLERSIETRTRTMEEAVAGARARADAARTATNTAQDTVTTTTAAHASEMRHLADLQELRAAQDLGVAEATLSTASARHATLPVPARYVTAGELSASRDTLSTAKRVLDDVDREIQRTHGALEQVGGAVARERLRDALEAFDLAERQEREIEEDYEAWRLLLEQMKEADAAQANNLGQALAPAIEGRFQALTKQRYQGVRLSAHLATEGVLAAGAAREPDRISVGTREQLSTLYRISLGEYLSTTIVLDDQLVQSDGDRMDWFRALLIDKARSFQIVVFTCRPHDYLAAAAMVPDSGPVHADTEDGFVRAIALERAVRRR